MSTQDLSDPRDFERNRPEDVGALATRVISLLKDRQALTGNGIRVFVIEHMMRAILAPGRFSPDALLDELRGYRLSIDTIVDAYVPRAAQTLGEQWVNDDLDFAQVTIGSMRLQALLSEATTQNPLDLPVDTGRLNTLIIVPQAEQHFLGASVLGTQLRRMGCEVTTSFDEPFGTLRARLLAEPPDLVLISCSRLGMIDTARQTVHIIRKTLAAGPVIAVGGAVECDTTELKARTGADIATCHASEAVGYCSKRADAAARS